MKESAFTGSPLLKVQPDLSLMSKVWESLLVIDWAIQFSAAAVFGLYFFRPRKIMSSTLPPCTSLVSAGSSGFCGSPQEARTMPLELPPPPLLPPPQAPAASATTTAPAAHFTRVAPRIVCLLHGHK